MTALDVEALRRDTAGCENVTHLNNAGAALPPRPVVDAVVAHLRLEESIGGYEAEDRAHDAVESTYAALAGVIGARPEDVAVVDSATRAWDMACYSVPFRTGDRVLVDVATYASSAIALFQLARRHGFALEVVPDDAYGQVDVDALAGLIDERVRLVALTHVPSQSGLVNPVAEAGRVIRTSDAVYLLDACQSVGQLAVDVAGIGCHFLTGTGRKFLRGPRGIGFLYAAPDVVERFEPAMLDLHAATWTGDGTYAVRADARRFESSEANVAAKIGLGVAARYALSVGLPAIEARVTALAERLRALLAEVPGVTVRDPGLRRGAIVTFDVAGVAAVEVRDRLRAQAVNASVVDASTARYDFAARALPDLVRASVHYFTTEAELDRLVAVVAGLPPSDHRRITLGSGGIGLHTSK